MSNEINRIVSTEEQIFDNVKDAFINKMNHVAEKTGQYYPSLTILTNLCCSEEEKQILLDLAIKIKENKDVILLGVNAPLSFKDICYAVIYTYYGLNLTEDLSYFNISVLPRNSNKEIVFENTQRWTVNKEFNYWINTHTDNISMVYYLYVRLGMPSVSQRQFGDIITRDGENLSEKLRKFVIPPQSTRSSASPIKPVKTSTRPISKRGGKKSKRPTKRPAKRTRRQRRRHHSKD
jgi:hypothetical protein